jgi:hemerythrin-like domain-containing protein
MAPWADEPFRLISIKSINPSASSDALFIASEMANAHNGLIRSLNSMYLQALYVTEEADIQDLLQFAIFWESWIEEHHHAEEEYFFPEVARITGEKDIMKRNIEQHQAFVPGMQAFLAYVKECKKQESSQKYEAARFKQLIDTFGSVLAKHLREEIETLLALEKYNIKAIKVAYVNFDIQLRQGDKVSPSLMTYWKLANRSRPYYSLRCLAILILPLREEILGRESRGLSNFSYTIILRGNTDPCGDSTPVPRGENQGR